MSPIESRNSKPPLSSTFQEQIESLSWLRAVGRLALEFDSNKLLFWMALRNTLGMALSAFVGFHFFSPTAATLMTTGALIVSFADGNDGYLRRFKRLVFSGGLCSVAVFFAFFAGDPVWLRAALIAVWAFCGGFVMILGTEAGDLGLFSLVMLIIFSTDAHPLSVSFESSMYCAFGAVIQGALALTQWTRDRYRPEKRELGRLYRDLGRLASAKIQSKKSPPLIHQVSRAQQMLQGLITQPNPEAFRLRSLLNQGERLRLRLVSLLRLKNRARRDGLSPEMLETLDTFIRATAKILTSVGMTLARTPRSGERFAWAEMSEPIQKLKAQNREGIILATAGASIVRDAIFQMESISGALRAAVDLSRGTERMIARDAPAPTRTPWKFRYFGIFATLRANFTFRSGAFRHGVRLATCLMLGELLRYFYHLPKGYWLSMTIALVLKPDFGTTISRGILRMGGSLVGLAAATLLFHYFHPTALEEIPLLSIVTLLMRWVGPANYGIYATTISAFIVLLTAILGGDPIGIIAPRGINTLLGGSMALCMYLIWPTWENRSGQERLATYFTGFRSYCALAFRAGGDQAPTETALNLAREESRLTRANFQAYLVRLGSEPAKNLKLLNFLESTLASFNRLAHATMAIETDAKRFRNPESAAQYEEFAKSVLTNFDILIESLLQSGVDNQKEPSQTDQSQEGTRAAISSRTRERMKDLRADFLKWTDLENVTADQPTLLAIELDRLTNSANTLADQIMKYMS